MYFTEKKQQQSRQYLRNSSDISSEEVRVLRQGGVWGGQLVSDWSKMQDGGWKAAF